MSDTPSNGTNGRDAKGRFTKGNPGGPGNPHAGAVRRWRRALIETVTVEDIKAVIAGLVAKAKKGERWAVKELLDRCLGRPIRDLLAGRKVRSECADIRALLVSPATRRGFAPHRQFHPEQLSASLS